LLGALLGSVPVLAGQAGAELIKLTAVNPDCLLGMRFGQAVMARAIAAQAPSTGKEEYWQFHAEALESSRQSALLPWPGLRMAAD
jgi:hypothetical protein